MQHPQNQGNHQRRRKRENGRNITLETVEFYARKVIPDERINDAEPGDTTADDKRKDDRIEKPFLKSIDMKDRFPFRILKQWMPPSLFT